MSTTTQIDSQIRNGRVKSRFELYINAERRTCALMDIVVYDEDYDAATRYEMPEYELLKWLNENNFDVVFEHFDDPLEGGLGNRRYGIFLLEDSKDRDELLIQLRWWGVGLDFWESSKNL